MSMGNNDTEDAMEENVRSFEHENKWVLFWGFCLNLVNTFIREAIHATEGTAADIGAYGRNVVQMIFFAILLFLSVAMPICYSLCIGCKKKKDDKKQRIHEGVVILLQGILVSSFYFIGDNLYPTVRDYGNFTDVVCTDSCQMDARTASLAFLSIATFMLFFLRHLFGVTKEICILQGNKEKEKEEKDKEKEKEEKEKEFNHERLGLFVLVVKTDILYTTVLGIGTAFGYVDITSEEGDYCDRESVAFGITIVVIAIVGGVAMQILSFVRIMYIYDDRKYRSIFLLVVSIITLAFYILTDDHLPLEFALCPLNPESSEYFDTQRAISIFRGLVDVTVFFVAPIYLGLDSYFSAKSCKSRSTKSVDVNIQLSTLN